MSSFVSDDLGVQTVSFLDESLEEFAALVFSIGVQEIDWRMSGTDDPFQLPCDLVALRCARRPCKGSHSDVGASWRCPVILEEQGPVHVGCLSIGKNELGLGRQALVLDWVLHEFDGLCKILDCVPAAHGSGTTIPLSSIA